MKKGWGVLVFGIPCTVGYVEIGAYTCTSRYDLYSCTMPLNTARFKGMELLVGKTMTCPMMAENVSVE